MDDFGAEVLVGMADDGAIKYVLEFDTPIVFVADEELEIDFLGVPYTLVSYIAGELTYRVSEEYEGGYGDEWTIDGQLVKVMEVDGDSDKVRIQVGDESEVIKLGKQKEINGLTVYVDDVFTATIPEDVAWVSLYIGEDITQEVTDGDEFNELEDWEWVIEDKNTNDLTKIGVVYVEDISDDKDLWHIEDGICLPLDYVCVEFQEVKNAEVTDIKFDISNTKLKVTFDGKLEIDGKRIDDGKFTVVDLGTFDYEYYYKGDKKESTVEGFDLTDIKFFVDDRVLNFDMGTDRVNIYDSVTDEFTPDMNYRFEYILGEFTTSKVAPTNAADMDDDEDFLMDNGDILYTSEVNTDDNDDAVEIGLVSDEALEVILKIQ